jgi:sigma-54 specific flagellar transcriptional regulator A
MIGRSEPMRVLRELIQTVAPSRSTVLITGESGTGKEMVAQALHATGSRRSGPFVPINCGAIPKDLLESELFGHRRGAFTGALAHRTGRFEMAHKGTLFLDEVGDLPVETQVKLLRVLQERRVEPLGSTESVPIDVRIIAATNRDLERDVQQGRFREDLFYRLNVIPIRTAPLRERPEDVPELLTFFARHHCDEGCEPIRFGSCLREILCTYEWPGNVRELSNLVDRFSALYPSQDLLFETIPDWMLPPALGRRKSDGAFGLMQSDRATRGPTGDEMLEAMRAAPLVPVSGEGILVSEDRERVNPDCSSGAECVQERTDEEAPGLVAFDERGVRLRERMRQIERGFIEQAMSRSKGNVSQAARLLSLQRTTLIEKLAKHGLRS